MLSIAALMTLLWGLIEAPAKGWGSTPILSAFGIGFVLLGVFIAWELHTDHPMLEIRFFTNARFSATNAGITLVFFALFGSSFLITQELQFVLGYSALKAGIAMMPIALPMLILGPLSARIVERVGTKLVVTAGLLCASGGLFWLSAIQLGGGYVDILLPMILMASGMGLTMAPATESIMGAIPRSKAGIGSAMNDTTRQVGGALGVAVIGSVLASVYRPHVTANLSRTVIGKVAAGSGPVAEQAQTAVNAIRDQLGAVYAVADKVPGGAGGPAGQELIRAARHAFVDGFGGAVLVGAIVAFLGAVVVFIFLPAHASNAPEDDPNVRFAHVADGELQTNGSHTGVPEATGNDTPDGEASPEPSIPAAAIGVVDPALVGAETSDAESVP